MAAAAARGDRPDEPGVVYQFAGGTACFLYPTPNAGTSRASKAAWFKDTEGNIMAIIQILR